MRSLSEPAGADLERRLMAAGPAGFRTSLEPGTEAIGNETVCAPAVVEVLAT